MSCCFWPLWPFFSGEERPGSADLVIFARRPLTLSPRFRNEIAAAHFGYLGVDRALARLEAHALAIADRDGPLSAQGHALAGVIEPPLSPAEVR